MRAGALAIVLALSIAACDRQPADPKPPPPSRSALAVPDVTTIDWRNQPYELSTLGTVIAKEGRAEFRLVEDAAGEVRADQSPTAKGANGSLVLAPAHYADLDGDGHDEAIVPFEMRTTQPDEAQHLFGVFAYTLREGIPLRIDVVTAQSPIDVDGAALSASEPPTRWRWVAGKFRPDVTD